MAENSTPSVDELEAKAVRLGNEVGEAEAAYGIAKQTFADAAKSDPTAVETLLELSTAVAAAKATVAKAKAVVGKTQTDIEGIRYDERMASVIAASESAREQTRPVFKDWFKSNSGVVKEYAIDTLVLTAKLEASGTITVTVKPTGENMPKRPSGKKVAGNGERGPRGTRNVTVNGVVMSCRDYVASCGTDASPAAQADLADTWSGAPVSYTNEAKRLAAKRNDLFA